ncbi:hypothetical protein EC973_004242 [Apophysomyces ossiformis]|uniref:Uncharacterized protein n=1 Tax=Apophysomyces ossiformis TaxID=679940 RepID=A0A8H7BVA7_9FUNG|nr:hypothetical protein EC973_004242 [Apophysomyces ossiformis]
MDSFLSTLPPYVHAFLDKHPPTDVFNLLRELVCFAVLYSNDRARINAMSEELIRKGAADFVLEQPGTEKHKASASPADKADLASITDTADETKTHLTESTSSTAADEKDVHEEEKPVNNGIPWTFPEWWGHREFEPAQPKERKARTEEKHEEEQRKEEVVRKPEPPITTWIPWENPVKQTKRTISVRNNVIPDLRSFLEKPVPPIEKAVAKKTSRKSLVQQTIAETKAARRMSAPVTEVSLSAKTPSPTPPTKPTGPPRRATTVVLTTEPKSTTNLRSASSYRPGQTATVRARAERAKQQQILLEEKKKKALQESVKINGWLRSNTITTTAPATVKTERRKTMPAGTVTSKAEPPTTTTRKPTKPLRK